MVKRKGGARRKSRHKFMKGVKEKGKLSLRKYFQSFNMGERVWLSTEPAVQKGMYWPSYIGKAGIITGKRGRCYEVAIKDGNKEKMLIIHPVHLKRS